MGACSICAKGPRTVAGVDSMLQAGSSEPLVAKTFKVHQSSVHRHKTNCLARRLEREGLRRAQQPPVVRVVHGSLDRYGRFSPDAKESAWDGFRHVAEELQELFTDPHDFEIAAIVAERIARAFGFDFEDDYKGDNDEDNSLVQPAFLPEADDSTDETGAGESGTAYDTTEGAVTTQHEHDEPAPERGASDRGDGTSET
jgi:hypothetical protein